MKAPLTFGHRHTKAYYFYKRYLHYHGIADEKQARANLIASVKEYPLPLSIYKLMQREAVQSPFSALSLAIAYYHVAPESVKSKWLNSFINNLLDAADSRLQSSELIQVCNTVRFKYQSLRSKIRVCILTAAWQREELLGVFIDHYKHIASVSHLVDITFAIAVSPGDKCRDMCRLHDVPYIEVANQPLSHKWQAALNLYTQDQSDFILILGSDDFISQSLLEMLVIKATLGHPLVGLSGLSILHGSNLLYWTGYDLTNQPFRYGETIGAGRIIANEYLEYHDYHLWGRDSINKGLDRIVTDSFFRSGCPAIKNSDLSLSILDKRRTCILMSQLCIQAEKPFHFVLDVKLKSALNVTPFASFEKLQNSTLTQASISTLADILQNYNTAASLIDFL